jgi:hypothetical protein
MVPPPDLAGPSVCKRCGAKRTFALRAETDIVDEFRRHPGVWPKRRRQLADEWEVAS